MRDATLEQQILKGLTTGGLLKVKSVRRDAHEPGDNVRDPRTRVLLEFGRGEVNLTK